MKDKGADCWRVMYGGYYNNSELVQRQKELDQRWKIISDNISNVNVTREIGQVVIQPYFDLNSKFRESLASVSRQGYKPISEKQLEYRLLNKQVYEDKAVQVDTEELEANTQAIAISPSASLGFSVALESEAQENFEQQAGLVSILGLELPKEGE